MERTLCQIPSVHIFKIPPRSAADGYRYYETTFNLLFDEALITRGGDWTEEVCSRALKIISKGKECAIILYDAQNDNSVYAVCPIKDGAVEKS